jgi:glycosyltransferase involved in cell wall biosynthesis
MTGDVAAVICTRNGHSRGFLAEALNSIFEQTVAPAEIILVDDGSTDGTADEVRRAYPGVMVLNNDGSGLAAARNTGIRAAHSSWIAFLDDDDVWRPTKLAEQLAQAAASKNPESTIWASRFACIGPSENKLTTMPIDVHYASWPACLLHYQIMPSGVMFSQALYRTFGPINEHINFSTHDFLIRCIAAGTYVRFSQEILLHQRRGHPQVTSVSHMLANALAVDLLLLAYLKMLPLALASRIRAVWLLTRLRSCAWHCGLASARELWCTTPLRPVRVGLRAFAYFALDSVACRAPHAVGQRLRSAAVRLLIGEHSFYAIISRS